MSSKRKNDPISEKDLWIFLIFLFKKFAANVTSTPTDLQLELIFFQSQTSLLDKFQAMHTIDFYFMLPAEMFPNVQKQTLKMIAMFTSTDLCKPTF